MLDAVDRSRLKGLMLTARHLIDGLHAGRHVSARHGRDLEFFDYRPYCPGDAATRIDWKLFGRTNRYHLRRQRQLANLEVYLMVDATASMQFAGLDRQGQPVLDRLATTKLTYAKTLAATIAFLTFKQKDRVGLGLFSNQMDHHTPPGGTWAHLQKICWTLEQTQASQGPGNTNACLQHAHALLRRRGVFVLIADLLDDPVPLLESLGRLRHDRFDVIVFQVLTAQELDLTPLGNLPMKMVDAETRQTIATNPSQIASHHKELMSKHVAVLRGGCDRFGIDYNLVTTNHSVVDALRRYLTHRSRHRRS